MLIAALKVSLTEVVMRAGWNVSAFCYNNRGYLYFLSPLEVHRPAQQVRQEPRGLVRLCT